MPVSVAPLSWCDTAGDSYEAACLCYANKTLPACDRKCLDKKKKMLLGSKAKKSARNMQSPHIHSATLSNSLARNPA